MLAPLGRDTVPVPRRERRPSWRVVGPDNDRGGGRRRGGTDDPTPMDVYCTGSLNVLYASSGTLDAGRRAAAAALSERHRLTSIAASRGLLRRLESGEFDVVVADLGCTGGTGGTGGDWSLLEDVRRTRPETPVVFLVRDAAAEAVAGAFRRGAADCIFTRGIRGNRLAEMLEDAVWRWRRQQRDDTGTSRVGDVGELFPTRTLRSHAVREAPFHEEVIACCAEGDRAAEVVEEVLAGSGERVFRTLADDAPDLILRFDRSQRCVYANRAFERCTGLAAAFCIGRTAEEIGVPGECAGWRERYREVLATGRPRDLEFEFAGPDGAREFHARLVPEKDCFGRLMSVIWVVRDVTAQRRAERDARQRQSELAHVQRVFTVGEMVAGLAHELKQPLSAIRNYAAHCLSCVQATAAPPPDTLHEAAQGLIDESERASDIIRRLQNYLRKREPHRSTADMNRVVADAMALTAAEAEAAGVDVVTELADGLPQVCADSIQMGQVVVNLVTNAIEAMREHPGTRRVVVRTRDLPMRGVVQVSVADTGPGIPRELRQRVFESFFTTKSGGLGVGLPISRSLVEAHGGSLSMEPNPDGGTTFLFLVPHASC